MAIATEIEIKISLADLKADAHKKHSHSSDKIKYLYFAIPSYMLEKALPFIPERAGIITVEKIVSAHKDVLYRVRYVKNAIENKNCRKFNDIEVTQCRRIEAMR